MNNTDKNREFDMAIQNFATGDRTFLAFGKHTTINDIYEVMGEETSSGDSYGILGMAFLSASSQKKLAKMRSDWRKHFDNYDKPKTNTRKK